MSAWKRKRDGKRKVYMEYAVPGRYQSQHTLCNVTEWIADLPSLRRSVASGVRIPNREESLWIPYVLIQISTMRIASDAMVVALEVVDTGWNQRDWAVIYHGSLNMRID